MNQNQIEIRNDHLYIYELNCNSIYKKLGEIKQVLYEDKPDIVCFSETWIKQRYTPKFNNYLAEWKHREGRGGGGLGILIHNSLQYQVIHIPEYADGALEVQAVKIYMGDQNSITILNIYNPVKNITYAELRYYIQQLEGKFLIIGDLNAHTTLLQSNATRNVTGRNLEKILEEEEVVLINKIDTYTYFDRRTGNPSCLDLCLSSPNLAIQTTINPLCEVGSDHLLMKIAIDIQPQRNTYYSKKAWKTTEDKLKKFKEHHVPTKLIHPRDVDSAVEDLQERITISANETLGNIEIKKDPLQGRLHGGILNVLQQSKDVGNHFRNSENIHQQKICKNIQPKIN